MAEEPKNNISQFLSTMFDRLIKAVSLITLSLTIIFFGLSWLIVGLSQAIPLVIIVFGLIATYEFSYRQAESKFNERSKPVKNFNILFEIAVQAEATEFFRVIKQGEYGGFYFRIFGYSQTTGLVEQIELPVCVSNPLCPSCRGHLLESRRILFPIRARTEFSCTCGFKKLSKLTSSELVNEVITISGMIKPDPNFTAFLPKPNKDKT